MKTGFSGVWIKFNTAITSINTAINKRDGGIELLCDTTQPNNGQMAALKAETEKLNEDTQLQRDLMDMQDDENRGIVAVMQKNPENLVKSRAAW